ncbi:MAG: hypothetical protein Fur0041_17700 [Bacteroidia bacterium]
MKTHTLNKPIAGYHLLMILSRVDGEFDKHEGDVIVNYLKDTFPIHVNLDEEFDFLASLPKEALSEHFEKAMNDFYNDSTEDERTHFLDFAVKMVKADNKITPEENEYLNRLFTAWDSEHQE